MKKITAVLSLVVLSVVVFSCWRCSPKPVNTNEILVWHWMTDRHQAFETLAKKYEEQTGVSIKLQLFAPPDTYSQRITASSQADKLPDIFGILDKKEIFADFIKYGLVADLTAEFQKDDGAWEKAMFPKALEVNRFKAGNIYGIEPGIYGVPIDV
ncbi:MAG: extracellular solute-binding protein, partial [Candidatus Omnitrophica bacterium]|nr:extracellular solute-binding protein [Candidatus Omnitrophota bacterium]